MKNTLENPNMILFDKLPNDWRIARLKYFTKEPLLYGANEVSLDDDRDLPRFIRITDISESGNLKEDTFQSLTYEIAKDFLLEDGDILLARSGATVGKSFLYKEKMGSACFAGYLIRLRCDTKKILPVYFYYFAYSRYYWNQINELIIQATIQNFSAEKYNNLIIPLPPLPTQKAIAGFLDKETSRIDSLISAKERFIGLLEEKRKATITEAVTSGLSPDVKMKDSGVEWLGKVPKHWDVERAKWVIEKIEQGWSPQCNNIPAEEDEWGVLKVGAVNDAEFNENENKQLPPDLVAITDYEIKPKDILMSRANTTELLGSIVLVKKTRKKLLLCDKLYRINLNNNKIEPEYFVLYLRSNIGRYYFEREATGASNSMQNIGQEIVRNNWMCVPPISEQKQIVDFIRKQTTRIDGLIQKTNESIELLKERRTALIGEAVTGKLKIGEKG
jgi:type I restriction enzyme, S subunit